IDEKVAEGKVKEIYEDIKRFFGMPFVPNLFKAMGGWPDYLEVTWSRFKTIMGKGKIDPKTKQVIALAVSATNNCEYCIHAHTSALKQMGYTDEMIVELMAVVDLYNGFNKFLDGLRVEPDLKS
ncbi:MAG: carboxymuconolactone decarboxylase family protein, partial [Nitrospirae bacterium]|nr:carboxymuconolactone decarboxylase family protein [Nitrospirota bacterium]